MNNNGLTFLQKVEEKVSEQRKEKNKIKTNIIDSIYKIVDEISNNCEANQYLSKLENDIFYGFDFRTLNKPNEIMKIKYNLDINVKTMMSIFSDKEHNLLKLYDLEVLKNILRNFKLIKELLLEYLPIDKQIQDFFDGLQMLHDENIMLSSDIQEIFDKINNNKDLFYNDSSLVIREGELYILNSKTRKLDYMNESKVLIQSKDSLRLIKELETEIENKFLQNN